MAGHVSVGHALCCSQHIGLLGLLTPLKCLPIVSCPFAFAAKTSTSHNPFALLSVCMPKSLLGFAAEGCMTVLVKQQSEECEREVQGRWSRSPGVQRQCRRTANSWSRTGLSAQHKSRLEGRPAWPMEISHLLVSVKRCRHCETRIGGC